MRLYLQLNGVRIPLAQVGGGRLYFDEPVSLPAGAAEVVVEIEGEARAQPVRVAGARVATRVVEFTVA